MSLGIKFSEARVRQERVSHMRTQKNTRSQHNHCEASDSSHAGRHHVERHHDGRRHAIRSSSHIRNHTRPFGPLRAFIGIPLPRLAFTAYGFVAVLGLKAIKSQFVGFVRHSGPRDIERSSQGPLRSKNCVNGSLCVRFFPDSTINRTATRYEYPNFKPANQKAALDSDRSAGEMSHRCSLSSKPHAEGGRG